MGKKRIWDKGHYCLYCGEKKSKIARHLQDMHSDESEVAHTLSFEYSKKDSTDLRKKKEKQRKRAFEKLRKRGNYFHNIKVLEEECEEFIPERRPKSDISYEEYL